jgi:hypothetical protein
MAGEIGISEDNAWDNEGEWEGQSRPFPNVLVYRT